MAGPISRAGASWLVGAAAALVLGQVGLAPPAVADTTTQVAGISVTTPDHSLVGTQVATVAVRLHLVDPDGVLPEPSQAGFGDGDRSYPCPCLSLSTDRTASAQANDRSQVVPLTLTSGTAQDGWWTGSVPLGSAMAGTWKAVAIRAGDLHRPGPIDFGNDFVPLDPALVATSTLVLTGADWPVISVQLPTGLVKAGSSYIVRGRLLLASSRRPVANAVVNASYLDFGFICGGVPQVRARTTSTGDWAFQTREITSIWAAEYRATSSCQSRQILTYAGRKFIQAVVTIRASATSVRAGSTVAITGTVRPTYSPFGVRLTEYRSGTGWVVIARLPGYTLTPTGTYRFTVRPTRGLHRYRVSDPSGYEYLGSVSPMVTVRAY